MLGVRLFVFSCLLELLASAFRIAIDRLDLWERGINYGKLESVLCGIIGAKALEGLKKDSTLNWAL